MNLVVLKGNLSLSPELRKTESGKSLTRFSVACNDAAGQTTFIPCTAFGKNADNIEKYFSVGSQILLWGRYSTGKYTNKDNIDRYYTEVIVDRWEFCGKKESSPEEPDNFLPAEDTDLPFA